MKARTLISATGAALALTVPAAHAMPLYAEGDGPAAAKARALQAVTRDDLQGRSATATGLRWQAMARFYAAQNVRHASRSTDGYVLRRTAQQPSIPVRPDDRAGIHGPNGLAVWNDGKIWGTIDAAAANRNEPAVSPQPVPDVAAAPSSSGFDWGDAGIGAGVTSGVVVLLLGGSLLLSSRRHSRAALS